jgi:multidrug transporter EmrE-like cation transporter
MKGAMTYPYLAITAASILGAAGQILLSLGAKGNQDFNQYLNMRVAGGLLIYGIATMAWIFALSRLPLNLAYAFTALTFILVYAGSALLLHEPIRPWPLTGVALIATGFLLIALCTRAR